ncbi:MAG: hypothetical protein JO337_12370 [Acidimicrobiales bacterium]|nr:hypothetical protein [Acidimicrobiales bacterium]
MSPRCLAVLADGPDGPLPAPATLAAVLALPPDEQLEVLTGWVVRRPDWISSPGVPVTSVMIGPGLRQAVAAGTVRPIATRLSAIPRLLMGRLRPDVAVVGAFEDRRFGGGAPHWRLAGSPGFAEVAACAAVRGVVIERWPGLPPRRAPALPECRVIGVIERADPPDPPPTHRAGPAHQEIGRLVAGLIPDGATIQWGPGMIGASVVAALDKPVRVHSGLVTEELADLADRGLLVGEACAAYLWGGPRLTAMVDAGRLQLRPISYTHDLTAISGFERFVAVNTALQVGLDGAANVEVAGGRLVSGPGGHPDFAAGAARSPGGLSIVALPATAGSASTVVARPSVVTTPRSDVDVVVTEFGVADLRGCTDSERARRLIEVAAPDHRDGLRSSHDLPITAG